MYNFLTVCTHFLMPHCFCCCITCPLCDWSTHLLNNWLFACLSLHTPLSRDVLGCLWARKGTCLQGFVHATELCIFVVCYGKFHWIFLLLLMNILPGHIAMILSPRSITWTRIWTHWVLDVSFNRYNRTCFRIWSKYPFILPLLFLGELNVHEIASRFIQISNLLTTHCFFGKEH